MLCVRLLQGMRWRLSQWFKGWKAQGLSLPARAGSHILIPSLLSPVSIELGSSKLGKDPLLHEGSIELHIFRRGPWLVGRWFRGGSVDHSCMVLIFSSVVPGKIWLLPSMVWLNLIELYRAVRVVLDIFGRWSRRDLLPYRKGTYWKIRYALKDSASSAYARSRH